jgi:uncharacterized membrane protein YukC
MDEIINNQLSEQDRKIEAIYVSVEKTRKYLLIIMWSSVAMIVLPLLLALVFIPMVISSYSNSLRGLI